MYRASFRKSVRENKNRCARRWVKLTFPVAIIGVYASSKAALQMTSSVLRHELRPFDVKVVTLITGVVRTNWFSNVQAFKLPSSSLYLDIKDVIQTRAKGETIGKRTEVTEFAEKVVHDLLRGSQHTIWRGALSSTVKLAAQWIPDWLMVCSNALFASLRYTADSINRILLLSEEPDWIH